MYYLEKNVTDVLFSKECYRCTMFLAYEGWKLNVNEECIQRLVRLIINEGSLIFHFNDLHV